MSNSDDTIQKPSIAGKFNTNAAPADGWLAAWHFAAEIHNSQNVPGTELPYLKHLGMVTMEIFNAHAGETVGDLALATQCAILHDSIEDQGVTHAELARRFGLAVADGVQALSKNDSLPKAEAMTDSLARIRTQPHEVWCVKLADRISNLNGAPAYWTAEKRATYCAEAQQILNALGTAHRILADRLATKIANYSIN